MANLWEAVATPRSSRILIITTIIAPDIQHILKKVIKIGPSNTPSPIMISKILAT